MLHCYLWQLLRPSLFFKKIVLLTSSLHGWYWWFLGWFCNYVQRSAFHWLHCKRNALWCVLFMGLFFSFVIWSYPGFCFSLDFNLSSMTSLHMLWNVMQKLLIFSFLNTDPEREMRFSSSFFFRVFFALIVHYTFFIRRIGMLLISSWASQRVILPPIMAFVIYFPPLTSNFKRLIHHQYFMGVFNFSYFRDVLRFFHCQDHTCVPKLGEYYRELEGSVCL